MVALPVLQDGLCPILRVHEGKLGTVIGQCKEALCHCLLVQGIRLFNGRENMLQVRMRGRGGMAQHGTQLPCPEQRRCRRGKTTPGRDDKNVRLLGQALHNGVEIITLVIGNHFTGFIGTVGHDLDVASVRGIRDQDKGTCRHTKVLETVGLHCETHALLLS
jgi:hypothetical protein